MNLREQYFNFSCLFHHDDTKDTEKPYIAGKLHREKIGLYAVTGTRGEFAPFEVQLRSSRVQNTIWKIAADKYTECISRVNRMEMFQLGRTEFTADSLLYSRLSGAPPLTLHFRWKPSRDFDIVGSSVESQRDGFKGVGNCPR